MAIESQIPGWMYNQIKSQRPELDQSGIEQTGRNQMGLGGTQPTAALGGPIKQFGYQNPNGPYGGAGGGAGGAYGSGSSGPTNAASSWYNGVLSGTNLPYSPFAKTNLESKATGMNAAAETARNQTMVGNAAANGASASDPSMAGAKLNSMAHRQTDNANSVQDIESQANQANFAAQSNAAAHLSQTQLAYDEMANSNAMRYSPFGQGGGGSSRRSQIENPGFLQLGVDQGQPHLEYQGGVNQEQDAEEAAYRASRGTGKAYNPNGFAERKVPPAGPRAGPNGRGYPGNINY